MPTLIAAAAICAVVVLGLCAQAGRAEVQAQAAGGPPCPSFQVLHNDSIGTAVFPKGSYAIKLLIPNFTCANASKRFTEFLRDFDGKLPAPWSVSSKTPGVAVFVRSGQSAFRVSLTSSGGGGGGGGNQPNTCPGNFRVLNNDRIGPLRIPKGLYRLIIPPGSIITCPQATKLFRQFLNVPSGNLPKNWRVKKTIALFFKPANPQRKKFRVDPGL